MTRLAASRRLCALGVGILFLAAPSDSQQPRPQAPASPPAESSVPISSKEVLQYGVEWRLIRAGQARITFEPGGSAQRPSYEGKARVESAGLVSKLYKVDDSYLVQLSNQLCADNILLQAEEGTRKRETKIAFDKTAGKAHYLERDLLTNTTVGSRELDVPPCVHDILAGLYRARMLKLEPGQSAVIPITDGKKFADVKVEAQEREQVSTPTGNHKTIRYEALLFNGVLYPKNARCFIWLTDDARRVPVQIQVRMRFLIGTITLTLEKEERS